MAEEIVLPDAAATRSLTARRSTPSRRWRSRRAPSSTVTLSASSARTATCRSFEVDTQAARAILRPYIEGEGGYIPTVDCMRILDIYGFPTAPVVETQGVDAALRAARELGYPVAFKVGGHKYVHKSDHRPGRPQPPERPRAAGRLHADRADHPQGRRQPRRGSGTGAEDGRPGSRGDPGHEPGSEVRARRSSSAPAASTSRCSRTSTSASRRSPTSTRTR